MALKARLKMLEKGKVGERKEGL